MLIFTGGLVRDAGRVWDALAVDAGVVVARGEAAIDLLGRQRVDVVDLEGGCLIPGFRDGHVHPLHGGVEQLGPPVTGATSVDEIGARLSVYVRSNPEQRVIIGGSYDPTMAPGGQFAAAWLDRFVPDRPVVLSSSDHHAVWVNSAALRAAGIGRSTPDPARGAIVRTPDGEPLGTLLETAVDLVAALVPDDQSDRHEEGLRRALRTLAACGVVWGQEAAASPAEVATYLDVAQRGELTCRFDLAMRVEPGGWSTQLPELLATREEIDARAGAGPADGHIGAAARRPLVTARCVKLFVDGVIEAGTAALLAPYADGFGVSGRPGDRGILNWEPDELMAAVAAVDRIGLSPHLHAIGDAAIRASLDAVAHARTVNGPRDRRPVIAHTQLVDPADLDRFAGLGVIANFEPLWAKASRMNLELTNPRLGPDRAARQYQMESVRAKGARISFGSDWPVTAVDPLRGLAVAITRQTEDGRPPAGWLPEERLRPESALAAYTSGTAYQAWEPYADDLLAPGAPADLCMLSGDPCTTDAQELRVLSVRGTWLAGQRVF